MVSEGPVRVRFAPSPTGRPHLGNMRTALFNWLFARSQGGAFVLRIEDTDQTRRIEGAVEAIYESLRWLGLNWDEGPDIGGPYGPYVQSERLPLYQEWARYLVQQDKAYYCYCSSERLEQMRIEQLARGVPPRYDRRCRNLTPEERRVLEAQGIQPVVRFKTPLSGKTEYTDLLLGRRQVRNAALDDFILMKSDGFPTYHLANIVDDHFMRITHVMRADEWLPSLPRHILLYQAFGWEPPAFIHLPLIVNKERKKLSKRDGDMEIDWYRRQGYLPEAMVNFLALMGWTPGTGTELMTLEEMVQHFSLERLSRSPAVFDLERLAWFNRQHLKRRPLAEVVELCRPYLQEAFGADTSWRADSGFPSPAEWLATLVGAVYEEVACLAEIPDAVRFAFDEDAPLASDAQQALTEPAAGLVLEEFDQRLRRLSDPRPESVRQMLGELRGALKASHGLAGRQVMFPVRAALTGRLHGPQLDIVIALLGRQRCLERVARVRSGFMERRGYDGPARV